MTGEGGDGGGGEERGQDSRGESESFEEKVDALPDPHRIREEDAGGLTEESYTDEQMAAEIEAYHLDRDGTGERSGPPAGAGTPPVRYRRKDSVTMRVWDAGERVSPPVEHESSGAAEAGEAPGPATAAANGAAEEGHAPQAPAIVDPEAAEFFRKMDEGTEPAPAAGAGAANGSAAPGHAPGGVEAMPPGRADVPAGEMGLAEFLSALDHKIEVMGGVNRNTHDDVVKAVRQGVQEIKAVSPSMETGHIADLVTATRELKEHLRVSDVDARRRREIRRSWLKWPLRGLVAVCAVGLVLAGVAGQARWGLMDDPLHKWKEIVWNSHGDRIAECIERASKRGGGARCAVSVEVR